MDKEARRLQVLECARDVFGERGYHATKVEDIVNRAGIARGTFYLYFQDKRSIFAELLGDFFATLQRSITRINVDDSGRDVAVQVRQNVSDVLSTLLGNKLLAKILLSDAVGLDPEFDAKLFSFYDEVVTLIETSLRLGMQMGLIRQCDPRVTAYCILGSLKEVMYQIVMGRWTPNVETLVDELVAYNMRGIVIQPG